MVPNISALKELHLCPSGTADWELWDWLVVKEVKDPQPPQSFLGTCSKRAWDLPPCKQSRLSLEPGRVTYAPVFLEEPSLSAMDCCLAPPCSEEGVG